MKALREKAFLLIKKKRIQRVHLRINTFSQSPDPSKLAPAEFPL
jgi:hypothetical protein